MTTESDEPANAVYDDTPTEEFLVQKEPAENQLPPWRNFTDADFVVGPFDQPPLPRHQQSHPVLLVTACVLLSVFFALSLILGFAVVSLGQSNSDLKQGLSASQQYGSDLQRDLANANLDKADAKYQQKRTEDARDALRGELNFQKFLTDQALGIQDGVMEDTALMGASMNWQDRRTYAAQVVCGKPNRMIDSLNNEGGPLKPGGRPRPTIKGLTIPASLFGRFVGTDGTTYELVSIPDPKKQGFAAIGCTVLSDHR